MNFKVTALCLLSALIVSACEAPPSVQRVIDQKEQEQAELTGPKLTDPVLQVAREDGQEVYNRYFVGSWAPSGSCADVQFRWEFTEDSFSRPDEQDCKLALIEALRDGSYAIAGYCPRLDTQDEAEVVRITRNDTDKIIIPGTKGGPLVKC